MKHTKPGVKVRAINYGVISSGLYRKVDAITVKSLF